mmetsp:Transcript_19269/g.55458  ORF Transcript_19269/g.55458 Transcript_19269/m.55458 type:complete len:572 (-) Transcript_19269:596-2311(-)
MLRSTCSYRTYMSFSPLRDVAQYLAVRHPLTSILCISRLYLLALIHANTNVNDMMITTNRHTGHPHGPGGGRGLGHRAGHPVHRPAGRRRHHPAHQPDRHQGGNVGDSRLPRHGAEGPRHGPDDPRRPHGVLQPLLPVRPRESVRHDQGERGRRLHRRRSAPRGGNRAGGRLPQARPVQRPPHRPDHLGRSHPVPDRIGLHLHLLRLRHRRYRRPVDAAPRPRGLCRPRPVQDRPAPRRRLRHLQPRHGPGRRQHRRRRRRRLGHPQDDRRARGGGHHRPAGGRRQGHRGALHHRLPAEGDGQVPGHGPRPGPRRGLREDPRPQRREALRGVRRAVHRRDAVGGLRGDRGRVREDQGRSRVHRRDRPVPQGLCRRSHPPAQGRAPHRIRRRGHHLAQAGGSGPHRRPQDQQRHRPGPPGQAHRQAPHHRRDRRGTARRRHRHRLRHARPRLHRVHGRRRLRAAEAQRLPHEHPRRQGRARPGGAAHPQGCHQRGHAGLGDQRAGYALPHRLGRRAASLPHHRPGLPERHGQGDAGADAGQGREAPRCRRGVRRWRIERDRRLPPLRGGRGS